MGRRDIPRLRDNLQESGHPQPKIFKLKRSWPPRPSILGKQKRAMVRKGGRKRVEDVGIEAHIPIIIAIKSIKLAKSWVLPFIAPSETPILEVNFMKLTRLKGNSESIDTTPVNIWLVLVPSPTNLVEIAKHQPTHPTRRLLSHKLREEVVFPIASGWPIYRCDFEVGITRRVEDVHIGRETKLGSDDVRHVQNGIIPKDQNPPSSPNRRTLGKATQPIAANVGSIKGGDGRKFSFLQAHNVARRRSNGRMDGVFTVLVIKASHVPTQSTNRLC
jgi:hypothetical protein